MVPKILVSNLRRSFCGALLKCLAIASLMTPGNLLNDIKRFQISIIGLSTASVTSFKDLPRSHFGNNLYKCFDGNNLLLKISLVSERVTRKDRLSTGRTTDQLSETYNNRKYLLI